MGKAKRLRKQRMKANQLRRRLRVMDATLARIRKAWVDLELTCAMFGHDVRDYVPGHKGKVCIRCGNEPKE